MNRRRRCLPARLLAALAFGCMGAVLVAGCSSSSSPSLFPAVLDKPPAREDTPMSPEQVKAAMDNLAAERQRLCAEAVANGSPNAAANCGSGNGASPGAAQTAGGAAKP
jgi:hypothetical protein